MISKPRTHALMICVQNIASTAWIIVNEADPGSSM